MRPVFHGTAGSMFPMVLKGLFLTIVTLGIYRFWYMTNVRRFLWNNSEVDGDFLEYTGRGVELFIGFLIAVAVLIPFYAVLFLGAYYFDPVTAVIVQIVYLFALVVLAQYALYRARRYRLTRTIWRGIRFQQSGSGWAYAWRSILWGLLTSLTLWLAYPWMRASLERYKMNNTWYGDQQGAFSGTGGQLFWKTLPVWLVSIVLIFAFGALMASVVPKPGDPAPGLSAMHWLITVVPFLLILVLAVVLSVYWAIEYKWWANASSIGPATASCDLGAFAFFKVYLGYFGVVLLFALALSIIGGVIGYALFSGGVFENLKAGGQPPIFLFVVIFALYFLIGLVFAALWQVFGVRPIWRKALESCEIHNLGALMAAQSTTPEANAFGEGIADAIDFGGF